VRDLAGGGFIAQQRNVVLVGGTGTGKTHLAIAIARSCIRAGSRGRFFTTVDLVNQLEAEGRAGRQGRSSPKKRWDCVKASAMSAASTPWLTT
jgi:DNA replication protein DnaC